MCLYIVLLLFAAFFGPSDCGRKPQKYNSNQHKVEFDVTTATKDSIAKMMANFLESLKQLKSTQIEIDVTDMEDALEEKPRENYYSITYDQMYIRQTPSQRNDEVEIQCNFSKALQIRIPLTEYLFTGYFDITKTDNTSIKYKYTIIVDNAKINFTSKSNYNLNTSDTLDDDKIEALISYDSIKVILEMPEKIEYSAFEAINATSKGIVSKLKSTLKKKLASFLQHNIAYSKILAICTTPKTYVTEFFPTFASEQQSQYFYFIESGDPETCSVFGSRIDWIDIRGLWNFVSLTVKQADPSDDVNFALQIDNVKGQTSWEYYIVDEIYDILNVNFTINTLWVNVTMDLGNRNFWSNTNVEVVLDDGNNGTMSEVLINKMLLKQLKWAITDNLSESIKETGRIYSRR